MSERKKSREADIFEMGFDEALARFVQTTPKELKQAFEAARRKEEEVEQYVEDRTDSIRRAARRSKKRFRL